MADKATQFFKNVAGKSGKIIDFIPIIDSSGDMKKVTELDAILNSWRNILLTPVGSYDHDPLYGSILYQLIWEPADNTTADQIRDEVENKLMIYDDRAKILNVNVDFFGAGRKGFNVLINVLYDNQEKKLSIDILEDGSKK